MKTNSVAAAHRLIPFYRSVAQNAIMAEANTDESACEFSIALSPYYGYISIICEKHKTDQRRLAEICVKRLLVAFQTYDSPFGSFLLRASGKDVSRMKLETVSRSAPLGTPKAPDI